MTTPDSSQDLRAHLARALTPDALARLDTLLAQPFSMPRLLENFASLARALGRAPLETDSAALPSAGGPVPLRGFTADVAGRVLLLLELSRRAPDALEASVLALYEQGDTLEKIAVLRALPLLPDGARFVPLALDAGRANDLSLLRALFCDNPFPARHYPELEWNKLVMKAVFVGLPLECVVGLVGLPARANPELARMALEYIEQQESAGRTFPPEIWQPIAAYPPPGASAKLLGYACHAVADVRLGAARGLLRLAQPRVHSFVRERLAVEPDARVRSVLEAVLACEERSLSS